MRHLTATICLTLAVLLGNGSANASEHCEDTSDPRYDPSECEEPREKVRPSFSGDFQKGLTAYKSGNYATALREWKPLAERGDAVAQSRLGAIYQYGISVPQDDKTAVKWYRLAAEQGNAESQYYLGFMYRNGRGVPQDDKTAVKWYRLAAEQGYSDAQYNLGWMHANGRGVTQDNVYAHMWYNIVALSGDKDAVKNRDIAAKQMTPADISTAQKLARECVRKKYKGC
jgi:uncharacterized protein